MIYVENAAQETTALAAERLAPHLRASDLVVLSGDLGAGKTFFTRSLLYAAGLDSEERVTSPTFTLVNEYDLGLRFLHADLYRLSTPEEVEDLGLAEARHQGAVLLVEWGRPYVHEMGGGALFVDFSLEPRRLYVRGDGPRAIALGEAWIHALGSLAREMSGRS